MQEKRMFARAITALTLALLAVCMLATSSSAVLLLDDSLQGSTSGTRIGGQFSNGGFQITGQYDAIYWHLPYPVYKGRAEFYVKGINPNEGRSWMNDKTEIYHMYDYTYNNSDNDYGGYRDNPYKHFVRKIGSVGGSVDAMELLYKIGLAYVEPDTGVLSWNSGTNYRFEEVWYPDGNGGTTLNLYRDGALLHSMTLGGYYNPQGPCVRVGASSRRMADYGAPLDAVYSYMKVWDETTNVPSTPLVTAPKSGGSTNTTSPRIIWAYTPASKYRVRLNTANNPDSSIVWDSGTVTSNQNFCIAGPVSNGQNYYVFVRLWNGAGWSSWSAHGHIITVNTAYVPANRGVVTISGRSFYDSNAHFVGLGATYMRAMNNCKYDRDRFRSDCAYLASQGFDYIRILTMVGWDGKPIAPIGFTNYLGQWIDGWSDYWQQFRDCIDIAYDEFGLRTEVVAFADAQNVMPNEADRYTHMDNIVANVGGRDHKVIFIEIANEYYQNGLTVDQLRAYGAYMNSRTGRLIALSAPCGDNNALISLYSGSAADIATEHFSRDIFTFEGGWLPVRDCWRVVGLSGVPACTSNEPVGPGSSVSTENDPIKLVSAACFAWTAGLPGYVYHTTAGVAGDKRFEDMAGSHDFKYLKSIMPAALASWTRNDGLEAASPFTVYCNGVANTYWTSNPGASTGCHRNIGARKDDEFLCYPQGILSGGVTLQAREQLNFTVYNPMTGAVVMGPITKNPGEQLTLSQGPGAYIIKGTRTLTPSCITDMFTYSNGALNNNGGWYGTATSSRIEVTSQMVRLWGGAGSVDAVRSIYCQQNAQGFIPVTIKVYAGTGARTIWNLWLDDTSGNNLARWYGTANTARGRIADTGIVTAEQTLLQGAWNTLYIKIYPATNTSQFFFNGTDLGTLSHSGTGAGDILGRVRLESIDNVDAVGHYLYFDDLSTEGDSTPPGNVTNFTATPSTGQNTLSWANPGDGDFAGVKIMFKTTGYPSSPSDGTQCYSGTGSSMVHSSLTNGVTYYYKAFAYDGMPNYASGAQASAIPGGDITPPGNVTGFTCTAADAKNTLSWTKPGDGDLAGVKIMFKTTGYPTGPTDGTQCYSGLGTSYVHTGLTNGTTYYYKAFAFDEVPNYSSGAQISGVPNYIYSFRDEFSYSNGALNGNGGWSGNATSSHIAISNSCVQLFGGAGSYSATKTVSIADQGWGYIWVRLKINGEVGANTIWSLWINDSSARNLARWYGSGTTARGRIGNTGSVTATQTLSGAWQNIDVKINPAANTSQFFFNGVSIGTLSHASEGAADTIGQIRFERMDNSSGSGNNLFFDDIRVGGS